MPLPLSQAIVEQWVSLTKGKFHTHEGWNEIGIESPEGKTYFRVILGRIEKNGIIKNLGGGWYRKIDDEAPLIDWQSANPNLTVDLVFPFGEHEFCKIFPKSIIIVAGSKNVGKTAYLYTFISLNMKRFTLDLFNSETSPQQMKERFEPLNIPQPAPFRTFERYDNFADVIHPEHISVIDYLDLNSEVYLVGAEIDAIFRKLTTGCAIIGLQKPPPTKIVTKSGAEKLVERDLAYGGGFTAKRAVLYITMGSNRLKLLYVKTPRKSTVNPNNMTFSFDFDDSGYFTNIQKSFGS